MQYGRAVGRHVEDAAAGVVIVALREVQAYRVGRARRQVGPAVAEAAIVVAEGLVDLLRGGIGHAARVDGVAVARLTAAAGAGIGHEVARGGAAGVDGHVARRQLPIDRRLRAQDVRRAAERRVRMHIIQAADGTRVGEGRVSLRVGRTGDQPRVGAADGQRDGRVGQRVAARVERRGGESLHRVDHVGDGARWIQRERGRGRHDGDDLDAVAHGLVPQRGVLRRDLPVGVGGGGVFFHQRALEPSRGAVDIEVGQDLRPLMATLKRR